MILKGVIAGKFIKLIDDVELLDGTEVEIVVKQLSEAPSGVPQDIFQAIKSVPPLSKEALAALTD